MSRDVGENLHAARAERLDRAFGFLDRSIHIVERHDCDKSRESIGMLPAKLRHRIVSDLRKLSRNLALRDVLYRRIGKRDDLPVVAELIHLLEPQIEIEQLFHRAQPLAHVAELGRAALKLLEKPVRKDMRVDVDDHRKARRVDALRREISLAHRNAR